MTSKAVSWSIMVGANGFTIVCEFDGKRSYIATTTSKFNAEMVLLALSEGGVAYLEMRDAMKSMARGLA